MTLRRKVGSTPTPTSPSTELSSTEGTVLYCGGSGWDGGGGELSAPKREGLILSKLST